MNRMLRSRPVVIVMVAVLLSASVALGQVRQDIRIPDVVGYKTLKCDFHMHTVFSDGLVWPTVRVDEAWREGLDAISITDHIEYQPHKDDVPTNHNRPYDIALPRANERGILLVKGAEITRETPPGHFNALFLEDITPLDTNDLLDAMAAADKQGAFIWWNHPGWKPEHKGWLDIHTTLYEKKYMRGIEVVNGYDYDSEVHQWAMEKDLVLLGNTDIHAPCPLEKTTPEKHRPMTLVFARDKSIPALKDAMIAGRTAVWLENQIIGRRDLLDALFQAAVRIRDLEYEGEKTVRFSVTNDSDLSFEFQRVGETGPRTLTLPANATARVKITVDSVDKPVELSYVVKNFLIGPEKGLPVDVTIPGQITINIKAEVETN